MALNELKCPSLKYVYKMTWAEFRLRLIGFNREEERNFLRLRRLAWITFIAPHQDPKKLRGMTEEKFMKLGSKDKPKVTEEHKQRFLELFKTYLKKQEHGRA